MLGSSRNWQSAGRDLADTYHVLAPDLRGYGDSDKPRGTPDHLNYSFRRMALEPWIQDWIIEHPDQIPSAVSNSAAVDFTGLKLVIGGAPLPKGLAQQAHARGIKIMGAYGMSETCPIVAASHFYNVAFRPCQFPLDRVGFIVGVNPDDPLLFVA